MFTLDELIIREGESIGDLIEDRARLFFNRFNIHPTTAFIPPDLYRDFMRELSYNNRHSFRTPNVALNNQHKLAFGTRLGTIELRVKTEVKNFLLVGVEETYADFEFHHGIPRELWSDSSRMKFDEDFEREILL